MFCFPFSYKTEDADVVAVAAAAVVVVAVAAAVVVVVAVAAAVVADVVVAAHVKVTENLLEISN